MEALFPTPRFDKLQEYIVSGFALALYVDSDRTAAVPRYIKVYLKKKKKKKKTLGSHRLE